MNWQLPLTPHCLCATLTLILHFKMHKTYKTVAILCPDDIVSHRLILPKIQRLVCTCFESINVGWWTFRSFPEMLNLPKRIPKMPFPAINWWNHHNSALIFYNAILSIKQCPLGILTGLYTLTQSSWWSNVPISEIVNSALQAGGAPEHHNFGTLLYICAYMIGCYSRDDLAIDSDLVECYGGKEC